MAHNLLKNIQFVSHLIHPKRNALTKLASISPLPLSAEYIDLNKTAQGCLSRGWILLFFLSLEAQIILEKSDRIEKCMFKQSVYFIVSEHLNLYVYCIEFIIGYS